MKIISAIIAGIQSDFEEISESFENSFTGGVANAFLHFLVAILLLAFAVLTLALIYLGITHFL